MRAILPLLSLSTVAQALYFFIDGTQPKCFYEELPKDTLVVGHYTAEEYDEKTLSWSKHDGLSVYISVDVRFHSVTCDTKFQAPYMRIQQDKLTCLRLPTGNLRQRPPSGFPAGLFGGPLHVHGARGRRPPALLHAQQQQQPPELAKRGDPQRRHQTDARSGHRRVERDREYR
jgi:hypothetical protein